MRTRGYEEETIIPSFKLGTASGVVDTDKESSAFATVYPHRLVSVTNRFEKRDRHMKPVPIRLTITNPVVKVPHC